MNDFTMPSLGADMDAGTLVEWKVKPGDVVKRGQVIAVVETDKGAVDVEIWEDGRIAELLVAPFVKVPVGTALARVEAVDGKAQEAAAPPAAPAAPAVSATETAPVLPAPPVLSTIRHVSAVPSARAKARELGIDLATVTGTGPHGVITRADVEQAAAPKPKPAAPPEAGGMRRAIAAAMARSKKDIPHYYLGTRVVMTNALEWLAATNASRSAEQRILPAALLLHATARAAREIPAMNGFWVDGAFRPAAHVHLGVAISLRGGGLIAPAIHDADTLSLEELMRRLADLVSRTRSGSLRSSELADSTLTVTNLGDLGVDEVYGIIFPPQVALVGFGRIAPAPVAIEDALAARPVVAVTLAADHRASDGHDGGRFLAAIERRLTDPEAIHDA